MLFLDYPIFTQNIILSTCLAKQNEIPTCMIISKKQTVGEQLFVKGSAKRKSFK